MNRGLRWVIIAAVIAVGGLIVYKVWKSDSRPLERAMMCATEGCGHTREQRPQLGESMPARCPKCEKDSLYPSRNCPQCGEAFILNEYRGLKPPTRCPKCGKEMWHGT
jgi:predicted RNA-binding Zn-ribbon protein involved in translation (DUF1610 family)